MPSPADPGFDSFWFPLLVLRLRLKNRRDSSSSARFVMKSSNWPQVGSSPECSASLSSHLLSVSSSTRLRTWLISNPKPICSFVAGILSRAFKVALNESHNVRSEHLLDIVGRSDNFFINDWKINCGFINLSFSVFSAIS